MEWYYWVIGGLAVAFVLLLVLLVLLARASTKLGNAVVGTWLKGNFGKRDR